MVVKKAAVKLMKIDSNILQRGSRKTLHKPTCILQTRMSKPTSFT